MFLIGQPEQEISSAGGEGGPTSYPGGQVRNISKETGAIGEVQSRSLVLPDIWLLQPGEGN